MKLLIFPKISTHKDCKLKKPKDHTKRTFIEEFNWNWKRKKEFRFTVFILINLFLGLIILILEI